jgi:radical SAM protein with 4Fe4S-binding SPASM domain
MVRYTVEKQVCNKVEIVTNGLLLTPRLSDQLIEAGLGRLVVSAQGTSAAKYLSEARCKIDFDKFVENLGYFYQHKGDAEMYIKVVDTAIDDEADRLRFHEIFGEVCDTIAIENTVPIHDSINFDGILGDRENRLTQYGLPVADVVCCPQPFFHMQINPDGKIVPCFSWDYPGIMGDCREQSLVDIWNGPEYQKFRRKHLEAAGPAAPACKNCNIMKYRLFPEDDLRHDLDRLRPLYSTLEAEV